MSVDIFKKQLHKILNEDGFEGSDKVLEEIKKCHYKYSENKLSDLRSDAIDRMASLESSKYVLRLRHFINSICESNVLILEKHMETIGNHVFSKFIFINRHDEFADLKYFCRREKNISNTPKVYQIRAEKCHRADWLFDRLRLHLKSEKNIYFHNNMRIYSLKFKYFKDDLRAKKLAQLPTGMFHLLPFVINAKEEDKNLDDFIQNFYDLWENISLPVNCVILLAVNIQNRKIPLWRKLAGKKPFISRKPDIMELSPIDREHVKTLFEDELKCGHLIREVQKEKASIEDFWEHLYPLIYKVTMR